MPPSLMDDPVAPVPVLDERHLTPRATQSPFLPGTQIQFAWDSTCLGLIKTCPRLYEYTIIRGYATTLESIHLRFGAEFHAALEHFDHLLASGTPREAAILGMVRETLIRVSDWRPDLDSKAGRYKNRESLIQLLVDYVDHFDPDPAETYIKSDGTPAVELSFRFELEWGPDSAIHAHPDGHETATPYLLCGHLDRVAVFNGSLFVLDRKTTTTTLSAYYFAQYDPNNQMTLYTLAGKVMLATPIAGVIIDAAQIKLEEPNAFARGFTYRTEDQLQEWLVDLRTTLNLAEIYATNGYWPMNDTSCDKFGGCKFRSVCSKSPSVRERFLKADFITIPEDQRWNPLRSR